MSVYIVVYYSGSDDWDVSEKIIGVCPTKESAENKIKSYREENEIDDDDESFQICTKEMETASQSVKDVIQYIGKLILPFSDNEDASELITDIADVLKKHKKRVSN